MPFPFRAHRSARGVVTWWRAATFAAVAGVGVVGPSCASKTAVASGTATLHQAAAATANAKSFTVTLAGVEVVYQAPDRVEQVEHGEASTASASSGGTASTSGPYPQTITKLFIGGRYYEASGPAGQAEPFSVSARCPGDTNAGEYVLGILRAIVASSDIHAAGKGLAFTIPKGGAVPFPISGIATVASGFVASISVSPDPGVPPVITIGSVNAAPPVTAPPSATEAQQSCGPTSLSGSGGGSARGSGAPLP